MLNNCFKTLTTRHDEKIMDRYIPSAAFNKVYRAHQLNSTYKDHRDRDEDILNMNQTHPTDGHRALKRHNVNTSYESASRDNIADALNLTSETRVFKFSPTASPSKFKFHRSSLSSEQNVDSANSSFSNSTGNSISIPKRTSMESASSFNTPSKPKKEIKTCLPYRYFEAPELLNDFYTNLISWSTLSNNMAVGLGCDVFIWSELKGSLFLKLSERNDKISCVSFSDSDFLIFGSKSGRLSLFSQETRSITSEHFMESNCAICCASWVHGSSDKFFVGDESGYVSLFEIDQNKQTLRMVKRFRCNSQQVCGIAISYDVKQIAVGGNDNCCTIWDVEDIEDPKFKFVLNHSAAVKAIAYCPWSNSLLATGGGSKDRHIRFWHSTSGTLLDSVRAQGQITSLIWSKSKKQIAATFGFTESVNPILMAVYSYPKLDVLTKVDGSVSSRVLSAAISPDSSCICTATNEQLINFYKVWNPNDSQIKESLQDGVLGSDLIELQEGITKSSDYIR